MIQYKKYLVNKKEEVILALNILEKLTPQGINNNRRNREVGWNNNRWRY